MYVLSTLFKGTQKGTCEYYWMANNKMIRMGVEKDIDVNLNDAY